MSQDVMDIVQIVVIILLPIIPAFILFKLLPPSDATVNGLLKGWNIKLKGAFAGYFAVVLLIFALYSVWHPAPSYQVWHVSGKLTFENGNPGQLMGKTDIETDPRVIFTEPDGSFDVMVSTQPGPSGTIEFPKLFIGNPEYEPVTIPLDDKNNKSVQRIEKDQRINLNVQLTKRVAAYNAPATSPQQGQGGSQ
jgi:hypothetical protein